MQDTFVLQKLYCSTSCIFNISCEVEVRPGVQGAIVTILDICSLIFRNSGAELILETVSDLESVHYITTSPHLHLTLSICFSYRKSFKLRILLTVFSLEYRKILFKLVEMHQPVRVWIRRNSLNWKAVFRFHSELSAMKYHMLNRCKIFKYSQCMAS